MSTSPLFAYERFLNALSSILAKAEAHCTAGNIAPEALIQFRLYPDMFPLARQVQLACDFAARAAARLAGVEPRAFPDTETSFAELQTRIATALAYIGSFDAAQYDGWEGRSITLKVGGRDMTFDGQHFLLGYSLPQFHFHASMVYAILRHNGVALGKRDYMAAN